MMRVERSENNIASIQLLRGLAAVMVMIHHVFQDQLPITNIISRITEKGWMGVEVFFIISGFVIPYSMYKKNYEIRDFKAFFYKRIVRIEPPYIVSIVLLLAFNWLTTIFGKSHGAGYHVDWLNVLGHLGYINAFTGQPWLNLAYWTLAIEFEYYVLLALMYPLISHRNKGVLLGTLALLSATVFLPLTSHHFFMFSPFFVAGMTLFLFRVGKISLIEYAVTTVVSVIIIYFTHGGLLAIISLATLGGIHYIKNAPKIFLFLGTISYSLYLTHGLINTRVMAVFDRFMRWAPVSLRLTLCLGVCFAFAYIFYLAFEKPSQAMSRKIHYHPGKTSLTEE